jgi:hypothetical protein
MLFQTVLFVSLQVVSYMLKIQVAFKLSFGEYRDQLQIDGSIFCIYNILNICTVNIVLVQYNSVIGNNIWTRNDLETTLRFCIYFFLCDFSVLKEHENTCMPRMKTDRSIYVCIHIYIPNAVSGCLLAMLYGTIYYLLPYLLPRYDSTVLNALFSPPQPAA